MANYTLTERFIKELHKILKSNTNDARLSWFNVGEYKKLPNEVAGKVTSSPKTVKDERDILGTHVLQGRIKLKRCWIIIKLDIRKIEASNRPFLLLDTFTICAIIYRLFWRKEIVMKMNMGLQLAYLFFLGSILGWILEVLYRRFSPTNKERKWVNPGFCIGPYLPIYGIAVCVLCSLAYFGTYMGWDVTTKGRIILFAFMALVITVIEYFAGVLCVKVFNVRLWDYRKEFLNIGGHVCLKFTFYWWLLSALYYFVIHGHIHNCLVWLDSHLGFFFIVGYFFGVFTIDVVYSGDLIFKMREFAKNNGIIVAHEKVIAFAKEKIEKIESKNWLQRLERLNAHDVLADLKKVEESIREKLK